MGELLDLGLHGRRDEFGRAVLRELQGTHIGHDGPALLGGELVAVTHHGVLAVGDDVVELSVRIGTDDRGLEAGDCDDGDIAFDGGAHLHDTVAVAGVAVTDGAVDLILAASDVQGVLADLVVVELSFREGERLLREAGQEGALSVLAGDEGRVQRLRAAVVGGEDRQRGEAVAAGDGALMT